MLPYEKPEEPSRERFVRLCPQHGEPLTGDVVKASTRSGECNERLVCTAGHSINPALDAFWVWDTQSQQRVSVVSRGSVRWEEWFFEAMRPLAGRTETGVLLGTEADVDEPAPFLDVKQLRRLEAVRRMERSKRYHDRKAAQLARRLQSLTAAATIH
jgi:hypothetical protein